MIGQSISEYKIVQELGSAGMGEIWLARDDKEGRMVALKLLPGDVSAGAGEVQRAFKEAQQVCEPSHPHICTVHGAGDHQGRAYLVMEAAEGEPLSQRLKQGPPDPDILLDLGVQIGDALRTAHARGITHGALTLDNLLVTEGDQIKIMDFGVARLARDGGSSEPGAGEDGVSEDIRSVGRILYAMATGRTEGPPASTVNERVPRALDGIVDRALGRGSEPPYRDLKELVDDLARVMSEAAREYVPPPPPPPEPERSRGLPWARILGAAALAVAALVLVRSCF